VAKAAAHWLVVNYRDAYGLFCCNGILFNHESPLRPARFVTQKIVASVCAIKRGYETRLDLGNIDVSRDWGLAEEYVEAMWRMVQLDTPTDLVIATGETHRLQEFVAAAFSEVGLDWRTYVVADESLRRPSDLPYSAGNPAKARRLIGWSAISGMKEVVRIMVEAEMAGQGRRV
jgi:GDPmannose 4,6-dehydratase